MYMDKLVRDVTLKVTGSLDIGQALVAVRDCLREWMKVDELILFQHDFEGKKAQVITRVTDEGVALHDKELFLLHEEVPEIAEKRLEETDGKYLVFMKSETGEIPIATSLQGSLEGLRLDRVQDHIVLLNNELSAGLAAVSYRSDVYRREHLELFRHLYEPFTVAIGNAVQFNELQKRRDTLAEDNELFREVTVRLTGATDIGNALLDTLQYLKNRVPLAQMALITMDPDRGNQNILLRVTTEGAISEADELIHMGMDQEKVAKRKQLIQELPETFVVDVYDDEIAKTMADDQRDAKLMEIGLRPDVAMAVLGVKSINIGLILIFENDVESSSSYLETIRLLKEPFVIALHNAVRMYSLQRTKERLVDENRALQSDMQNAVGNKVIGMHHGLKHVMTLAGQVAKTVSPVLLHGETGSGKEVVATAIHRFSDRSTGPFISLNCGAIPETLIDSELFGHEKGAFTGANERKLGRFERADGGTLFLDEVGELPMSAQVKLLRVLQEKEFERIGGNHVIRSDVRLIAATNRDLPEMIRNGQFREDLWFRLNVFPIEIPPLRERREDIASLSYFFIESKSRELNLPQRPALPAAELDNLVRYDWPGNVRELQNAVERALILSRGEPLQFPYLAMESNTPHSGARTAAAPVSSPMMTFNEMAAQYFRDLLELTGGRISGPDGAAKIAGINPSTLRSKLKKIGCDLKFGRPTRLNQ